MSSADGKVAQIIDENRVVLNRGSSHGVAMGDRYLIYSIGPELFDPDTNESLGSVELVKGRGEVIHVQPKLSTLETYEYETGATITRKNPLFGPLAETITEPQRFKRQFDDPKVGDHARRIFPKKG